RAPINAERIPIDQTRSRRRPREGGEHQMAQLAVTAIVADAWTAPVGIVRGREPPFRYAAVVQPRHPRPGIVPRQLSIGRAAGGLRVIGVLEPGQIALDIVEQSPATIDQQRSKENSIHSPPDQEPVEKRREPNRDQSDQPLHHLTDVVIQVDKMRNEEAAMRDAGRVMRLPASLYKAFRGS